MRVRGFEGRKWRERKEGGRGNAGMLELEEDREPRYDCDTDTDPEGKHLKLFFGFQP